MSVGINPVGYKPAFAAEEAAPQNIPQQTELPPSDKKYEKNGKKVKANIGPLGGTALAIVGASCSTPYFTDLFESKKNIDKSTKIIAENKEKLPLLTNDFEIRSCQEIIDGHEELLEKYAKDIKSDKKGGIIAGIIGIAASIGAIAITNHLRNNKRAALAAEPENPALDK
jgi:hypothetical protein